MDKEEQLNQEVETEWTAQRICSDLSFLDQLFLYAVIADKELGNTQSLKSISSKFPDDIPAFLSKYVE